MCPVLLVHLGLKGKNSFMAHHWDECVRRISIGRHSHHHSNFEKEKKEFFFREATEAKKSWMAPYGQFMETLATWYGGQYFAAVL